MARSPYAPTKDELRRAPPRVLYELNMFRASIDLCMNLDGKNDPVMHNVALEATLLHARNLLDFFTGGATSKDDIHAAHFISTPGANWWKSSKLSFLSALRDDLNYSISHLTYRRVQGKPKWHLKRIASEIEAAFEEFLQCLPNGEQAAWKPNNKMHRTC